MKIGPHFYGGNKNFRVEGFYEGKTLSIKDVASPVIYRKVFATFSDLHKLEVKEIPKMALILRVLENKSFIIDRVLKKIKEGKWSKEETKMLEAIKQLTTKKEIDFLKSIMPKEGVPVFCHNDGLHLNIM